MCLLVIHPAATQFDKDDLEDFFFYNQDGLGVMYIEGGTVVVHKTLPKTADEAWEFYKAHAQGRECALHWRMRTHGDIDLEHNCHPYEIMPGYHLMHNGVLSTGNKADTSKSDSWHYARNYLRPQLEMEPRLIGNAAWQEMLGEHIGKNNRFVLMHPGGMVSINMPEIKYKGATMSNTYAWSAPLTHNRPGSYSSSGLYTSPSWWGVHGYEDPVGADDDTQYDQSLDDTDDAVEYLFDVLDDCAYWDTYNALSYADAEALYDKLGEEGFNFFASTLYESGMKDSEVLRLIRNPEEAMAYLYGGEEVRAA